MTAGQEHQPGQHMILVMDKPRLKHPIAIPAVQAGTSEHCSTTFFLEFTWLEGPSHTQLCLHYFLSTENKCNLHRNTPPLNNEVIS